MSDYPPGPGYPQQPGATGQDLQGYPPGQYPYQPDYFQAGYGPYDGQPTRQSICGLAAFIIGLFVVLTFGGLFGWMVLSMIQTNRRTFDKTTTMLIGFTFLGGAVLSVLGIGLGIGSLFERQRKKSLGIAGLILNAVIVAGVVGMVALGLALKH